MKRLIILCFSLLILFSCSAQTKTYPTDDSYHADTDHPYAMDAMPSFIQITDNGDGYYFFIPMMLMFAQKESMNPLPVCSKPNCLHYEENDPGKYTLCDAFFISTGANLYTFWLDDALYLIQHEIVLEPAEGLANSHHFSLVKVSSDGSRRETIYDLGTDIDIITAIVHRGYLYVVIGYYDESPNYYCDLTRYSLSNTKEKPRVLYQTAGKAQSIQFLTAYGQRVYFKHQNVEARVEDILYAYNIGTGDFEQIIPSTDNWTTSAVKFYQDRLIVFQNYYLPTGETRQDARVLISNLDGSDPQPLSTGDGIYASDSQYLYVGANFWDPNSNDHYLRIYNNEFEVVDQYDLYELPGITKPKTVTYYATMGEQVLVYVRGVGDSRQHLMYFDKAEIGSGNIQVHEFFSYEKEYMGPYGR